METRWATFRDSHFALKNLPRWLPGRLGSRLPAFYATCGRRFQETALFRFFGLPRDCFSSMFASLFLCEDCTAAFLIAL